MSLGAAALCGLLLAAGQPAAAGPRHDLDAYLALARGYRSADVAPAIREIRLWHLVEIERMVAELSRQGNALRERRLHPAEIELRDVEAAILLHAHVGLLALRAILPVEADVHFASAQRLQGWTQAVAKQRRNQGVRQPSELLTPRIEERDFYVGLTGSALALWGLPAAERFADAGLRRLPTDADLLLLAGCVQEALANEHSFYGRGGQARRALDEAEKLFRNALALDEGRLETRLRLGRVRQLQGRVVTAELPLETVAREAADNHLRYLAWLFLGKLHDHQRHLDRAAEAYKNALAAQPDGQAARLGLAWVEDRQTGPLAAHRALMELLGTTAEADRAPDPWWSYAFGPRELTAAALERLRVRVQAP